MRQEWLDLFRKTMGREPSPQEFKAAKERGFSLDALQTLSNQEQIKVEAEPQAWQHPEQASQSKDQHPGIQDKPGQIAQDPLEQLGNHHMGQEGPIRWQSSTGEIGQGLQAETELQVPEKEKKSPWLIVLIGLLVTIAISAGVYFFLQSQKDSFDVEPSSSIKESKGQKKSSKDSSDSSSKVSKESSTSESSSSKQEEASSQVSSSAGSNLVGPVKWNGSKASRLNSYVFNYWGPAMGQTYRAYSPGNNASLYGASLPDDALNDVWNVTLDGQTIHLDWSTDGRARPGKYALVAVLTDTATGAYLNQHVYFFVVKDGQPRVLVTEQNQGNPENRLYFRDTGNTELRDFYYNLVNE